MFTGVYLTQLHDSNIAIKSDLIYKNLIGVAAIKKQIDDVLYQAKQIGFNWIVDTINPTLLEDGSLAYNVCEGDGVYWPLCNNNNKYTNDRITFYQEMIYKYQFDFLAIFNFPEQITEDNWLYYANEFLKILEHPKFSWINQWQIGYLPDELINNNTTYKIDPIAYTKLLQRINSVIKINFPNKKIGGPGCSKEFFLYLNETENSINNWLKLAIDNNLFSYIDFFTFSQEKFNDENGEYLENLIPTIESTMQDKINAIKPICCLQIGTTNNDSDTNSRAYHNVKSMLNCVKYGIIPLMYKLFDNVNDTFNYGIFDKNINPKNDIALLQFISTQLDGYNNICDSPEIYTNNDNLQNISFINNAENIIKTIIWSKNMTNETVIFLKNLSEKYYLINDAAGKDIYDLQNFKLDLTDNFVIIEKNLQKDVIDYDKISEETYRRYLYFNEIRDTLLQSLPSEYNINTTDTNFYRLLRSLAFEDTDFQMQLDVIKDDICLDTAHDDAIYKNFGVLVNLQKMPQWNDEKYRNLVKGVTKSLLKGPTLESIKEGVDLFTSDYGVTVDIHELYKKEDIYSAVYTQALGPKSLKYAFAVEVNIKAENYYDNSNIAIDRNTLNNDIKYVVDILKPAHTLYFLLLILTGEENYKDWYYKQQRCIDPVTGDPLEFKDSDIYTMQLGDEHTPSNIEGIFGWKHLQYNGNIQTWPSDKNTFISRASLIGPRYMLQDTYEIVISYDTNEHVNICSNGDFAFKLTPLQYMNYKVETMTNLSPKYILEYNAKVNLANMVEGKYKKFGFLGTLNNSPFYRPSRIREHLDIDAGEYKDHIKSIIVDYKDDNDEDKQIEVMDIDNYIESYIEELAEYKFGYIIDGFKTNEQITGPMINKKLGFHYKLDNLLVEIKEDLVEEQMKRTIDIITNIELLFVEIYKFKNEFYEYEEYLVEHKFGYVMDRFKTNGKNDSKISSFKTMPFKMNQSLISQDRTTSTINSPAIGFGYKVTELCIALEQNVIEDRFNKVQELITAMEFINSDKYVFKPDIFYSYTEDLLENKFGAELDDYIPSIFIDNLIENMKKVQELIAATDILHSDKYTFKPDIFYSYTEDLLENKFGIQLNDYISLMLIDNLTENINKAQDISASIYEFAENKYHLVQDNHILTESLLTDNIMHASDSISLVTNSFVETTKTVTDNFGGECIEPFAENVNKANDIYTTERIDSESKYSLKNRNCFKMNCSSTNKSILLTQPDYMCTMRLYKIVNGKEQTIQIGIF